MVNGKALGIFLLVCTTVGLSIMFFVIKEKENEKEVLDKATEVVSAWRPYFKERKKYHYPNPWYPFLEGYLQGVSDNTSTLEEKIGLIRMIEDMAWHTEICNKPSGNHELCNATDIPRIRRMLTSFEGRSEVIGRILRRYPLLAESKKKLQKK